MDARADDKPRKALPRTRPFPIHDLPGRIGLVVLVIIFAACLGSLPWTLAPVGDGAGAVPRYNAGDPRDARLPPNWIPATDATPDAPTDAEGQPAELAEPRPTSVLGTDHLGRSVFVRALTGGGISLGIGLAAAAISVLIGTIYGAIAGYTGGAVDGVMMRIVDVLYGLPYILLVVLLAVASDAFIDEMVTRARERADWTYAHVLAMPEAPAELNRGGVDAWLEENPVIAEEVAEHALAAVPPRQISQTARSALDVCTLFIAIGGVSWLTLARVIRGQVLSLKNQPFIESARAAGAHPSRIFAKHLLPNLIGPIVVYVTLTVPQAILQESFLSFLGIGVKPPLPSWGNLAADGLNEVNPYKSHWWLLAVPSVLLGVTLLALNFVGEGLRESLDPKRNRPEARDA